MKAVQDTRHARDVSGMMYRRAVGSPAQQSRESWDDAVCEVSLFFFAPRFL